MVLIINDWKGVKSHFLPCIHGTEEVHTTFADGVAIMGSHKGDVTIRSVEDACSTFTLSCGENIVEFLTDRRTRRVEGRSIGTLRISRRARTHGSLAIA